MKLSICIPHRGPFLGLWATISACRQILEWQPHEFIVCVNGIDPTEQHQRLGVTIIHSTEPIGPSAAREVAARYATGEALCFLDDHVIPHPQMFRVMLKVQNDVMFCPSNGLYDYEPEISLLTQLESTIRKTPRQDYNYPCISGSNGSFMVMRSVWEAMQGYGEVFSSYCNDEVYFGLRALMFGFQPWFFPKIPALHYSAYPASDWKNHDDEYQRQMDNGLIALRNLRTRYTLEEVYERASKLNEGVFCI